MNDHDRRAVPHPALARAVERLCAYVRVPSVSARGEALEEGARHTAALLREIGLQVEVWREAPAPVVFGCIEAPPGAPTVLIYGHYDVQPPEPLEEWTTPPFEPAVRNGAVFGRGAGDDKGQLLAHLVAVESLAHAGTLPVGVKVLVEGQEEIGSPGLEAVVRAHAEQLRADLALTSDAPKHAGQPTVIFGVRGLLYLEIEARGANYDLHSGNYGGVAPMPAWELVRALACLRDAQGRVSVPGFSDDVLPPTERERRMLERLPIDRQALERDLGRLPDPVDAASLWDRLMFRPTLNVAGLDAGYHGPGTKTVIPRRAQAKLEARLVAAQDPERVARAIAARIHAHAPRVQVRVLASVPPSATPPENPWAAPVIRGVTRAAGRRPLLRPRLGGTTPDYLFTRLLRMPSFLVPFGPADMHHHAPNERMTLSALEFGIRCSERILLAVGAAARARTARGGRGAAPA